MAYRLILALLALLTGLAAPVGPAHARPDVAQSAQVCAVGASFGTVARAGQASWLALAASRPSGVARPVTAAPRDGLPAGAPCVRIGIDRARE